MNFDHQEIAQLQAGPAAAPTQPPPAQREHRALSNRWWAMVWAPVACAVLAGAVLWGFVSHALMSNPLLNGIILAVMSWGVWTMAGHVRRVYREDDVFRRGMRWLRGGVRSGEQDPRLGPNAYVTGMLERLQKLGLGHQVYIHSAATGPEIEALEQYFDKKQELSQFLVGLMVGLGLLGTFVGLLETLVQTSELIGTIANSAGGGGQGMEKEFAKIVGGLQGPLAGMGTAFSASMFGLVGSIVLGFQMVVVRKAVSDFVESARREVLSLAEKSKVSEKTEITERFLATLLADMIEQHRAASKGLRGVVDRLDEALPRLTQATDVASRLAERVHSQEQVMERAIATVGGVGAIVPVVAALASTSQGLLAQSQLANERVERMLAFLPEQERLMQELADASQRVTELTGEVRVLQGKSAEVSDEMRRQAQVLKRMDSTLWNTEIAGLRAAAGGGESGKPGGAGNT